MRSYQIIFSLMCVVWLISTPTLQAKEMSKIMLRDGTVLTGEILEELDDGSLVLKTSEGFTITINQENIYQIMKMEYPKTGSFGVGIGIPYGTFGLNFDVALPVENVYLTVGFGTTIFAGAGFGFGAKYYLREIGNTWRPRIIAVYGTNSMILDDDGDLDGEQFSGLNIGVGQQWTWGDTKKHGMDLDFIYILTNGDFDRKYDRLLEDDYYSISSKPGRLKVSLGYRYCF